MLGMGISPNIDVSAKSWKSLLEISFTRLDLKVLQLWARTSVKFETPTWQKQMWQTWMWQVGTQACASSNGPPGKFEVGVRPVFLDPFLSEKTHTFNASLSSFQGLI